MKRDAVFKLLVAMEIVRIPRMEKQDYDALITEGYVSRIAFLGEKYPYIAPFLYVFDRNFMYFLSTRYGKKIRYFRSNPYVSVEVERYSQDLSCYMFVTLQGRLEEVEDAIEKKMIRGKFVNMIKTKNLSKNILAALGILPQEPIEAIANEERSILWRLTGVTDIVALQNM
jgi:nitroimidazol reductase NimA-like FMN-containing flavoprotein (pyridoxamine 5'-phosphate oxidase superfamily)